MPAKIIMSLPKGELSRQKRRSHRRLGLSLPMPGTSLRKTQNNYGEVNPQKGKKEYIPLLYRTIKHSHTWANICHRLFLVKVTPNGLAGG